MTILLSVGCVSVLCIALSIWSLRRMQPTLTTVLLGLSGAGFLLSGALHRWINGLLPYLGGVPHTESTSIPQAYLWLTPLEFTLALLGAIALLNRVLTRQTDHRPKNPPKVVAQNILTIVIVLAAVYFSITAMIAASLTKGIGVEETALAEVLKKEIESVSMTDNEQRSYFEADLNNIDSMRYAHPEFGDYLYSLHWHVDAEVIDVFDEMLPDMQRRVLNQMVASDQANLVNSLKQEDKDTLLAWYQDKRRQCIKYLNVLTERLVILTYDLKSSTEENYNTLIQGYQQGKPTRFIPGPVPKRSKQGDFLGVFEKYMGWLLEIESYSLVMIIGMAGFGLLGAVSGSFVKETGRRHDEGGPLIEDMSGVMIKGFTAALVIFLGIQGSLAVLGNGMEPPDSNLLFFMALVGSVFSDKAWDWAKAKFEETLAKEGEPAPEEMPANTVDEPPILPMPTDDKGGPDFLA